jgi:hypothetical protein
LPHHNYKPRRKYGCTSQGLYKFNKEIFRSIYATLKFIWFKTSYTGEWNIDEKLDSINAELIVIGIEHGNDRTNGRANTFKNDKYGGGNADAYLEFIVKTLKPQIKSKELRQKKNINYG